MAGKKLKIVVTVAQWWKKCRRLIQKQNRTFFNGFVVYFWWNIWKERNRRVFNKESKNEDDVAFLIKEDF